MASSENLQRKLPALVDEIVRSVHETEKTQHIGRLELPHRDEVIRILLDLQTLILPGYFHQRLGTDNVQFFVGGLVDSLSVRLNEQIAGALRHEDCEQCGRLEEVEIRGQAEEITARFLDRIPRIRSLLEEDIQAAYDGDPAAKNFAEIVLCYPGFEAILTYRLAHELLVLGVPLIPRIMTEYVHHRTGIDIHPGARIGERFFIDHGTGVVIGETTIIGNNVKLYQGVTLGALSFPKDERGKIIRGRKRHPTIEDDVTIYANATILGGDTVVGRGSVVGGNVWLTESVPPYTKIVIETPKQLFLTNKNPASAPSDQDE